MSFLRRLLGGTERTASTPDVAADAAEALTPAAAQDLDALERAHELEMAMAEQERLDELQQRQLRYASYAWQPPDQGGERRADDKAHEAS
jgi:PhoPQ-activated pathogenicity-related protein